MGVLVLGAYGLVGSAIVDRLLDDGMTVIGLGRRVEEARRRRPEVAWRQADIAKLSTPDAWAPLLDGVDAVVNAAGALQSGLRDDLAAVQHVAIAALVTAAQRAGAWRFVQISGVGVEDFAHEPFFTTKAAADRAVQESGLDWVVLRPGVVISPVAYGGTALLRGLAAFPWITPLAHVESTSRCIGVADVAEAVSLALRGEIAAGQVFDLVEPGARPLHETVALFRAWLGLPPVKFISVPAPFAALLSASADALGWLGWRSPLRSTALRVMAIGVDGDPAPAAKALGRNFASLPEVLRRTPPSVQELWFARLWLLKPVILALLCLFWIASGLIGLWRQDEAALVLTSRGTDPGFAKGAVLAGGIADIALGLGVAVRPWADAALKGMVALTLAYLVGSLFLAPDLWLDPLGAMVKSVCVLALCLVGLAVLEER